MAKKDTTLENLETFNNLEDDVVTVEEDINLDAKVTVKNLSDWNVYFVRRHDGGGDIMITANGEQRLSRNEIQAQVNSGNKLFIGIDGVGSHAGIYIKDAETRRWLGFETKDNPQQVFSDKVVKDLFAMKQDVYETELPKRIVTRAEKKAFMNAIERLGLNDYRKISYAVTYTGLKI